VSGDLTCRGRGIGVGPGGILTGGPGGVEGPVTRLAFPGADGALVGFFQQLPFDRLRGELVLAFHHHGLVALGDDGPVPRCSHWPCSLVAR